MAKKKPKAPPKQVFAGPVRTEKRRGPGRNDPLYEAVARMAAEGIRRPDARPMFRTDVDPRHLWEAYLALWDDRQHYDCSACRGFVVKYGGLVRISAAGDVDSVVWDPSFMPDSMAPKVLPIRDLVQAAKIAGVFYSPQRVWGQPETNGWRHLHGHPAAGSTWDDPRLTAGQAMAEKREEHAMVMRTLDEVPRQAAEEVVRVLRSGALDQSERALPVAEWLVDLHDRRYNPARVWQAVATAPAGWAHVRNTVAGTLIEDVRAGLPFAEIKRRWDEKMHPLKYQRPTAAPSAGAIESAERLVEKLGVAKSFERRFARLDELPPGAILWRPRPPEGVSAAGPGGVFGHLRRDAGQVQRVVLPAQKITWAKFRRDVLPGAREIRYPLRGRAGFFGLATAVHADAPPLFQWGNPFSWYFYHGGSAPGDWGLAGTHARVSAVFLGPHQWGDDPERHAHQGRHAFFALEGAQDRRMELSGSACLFPACLSAEYHGIRAVVEAHSRATKVRGWEAGTANGIDFDGRGQALEIEVDGDLWRLEKWE